jgi:hypothetical protein
MHEISCKQTKGTWHRSAYKRAYTSENSKAHDSFYTKTVQVHVIVVFINIVDAIYKNTKV